MGQWSVVCGNSLVSVDNIRVVCNQLGFDPDFVRSNNLPQSTSVLNVGRPVTSVISTQLRCRRNDSDLTACPRGPVEVPDSLPGSPGKRQAVEPLLPDSQLPCSSLEIQCGGKYRQAIHTYN